MSGYLGHDDGDRAGLQLPGVRVEGLGAARRHDARRRRLVGGAADAAVRHVQVSADQGRGARCGRRRGSTSRARASTRSRRPRSGGPAFPIPLDQMVHGVAVTEAVVRSATTGTDRTDRVTTTYNAETAEYAESLYRRDSAISASSALIVVIGFAGVCSQSWISATASATSRIRRSCIRPTTGRSCGTRLQTYLPQVKKRVSPNQPFGVCIRLSHRRPRNCRRKKAERDKLKAFLKDQDLYVYTANAFVYGVFKNTRIKEQVYEPDWRTPRAARVHDAGRRHPGRHLPGRGHAVDSDRAARLQAARHRPGRRRRLHGQRPAGRARTSCDSSRRPARS